MRPRTLTQDPPGPPYELLEFASDHPTPESGDLAELAAQVADVAVHDAVRLVGLVLLLDAEDVVDGLAQDRLVVGREVVARQNAAGGVDQRKLVLVRTLVVGHGEMQGRVLGAAEVDARLPVLHLLGHEFRGRTAEGLDLVDEPVRVLLRQLGLLKVEYETARSPDRVDKRTADPGVCLPVERDGLRAPVDTLVVEVVLEDAPELLLAARAIAHVLRELGLLREIPHLDRGVPPFVVPVATRVRDGHAGSDPLGRVLAVIREAVLVRVLDGRPASDLRRELAGFEVVVQEPLVGSQFLDGVPEKRGVAHADLADDVVVGPCRRGLALVHDEVPLDRRLPAERVQHHHEVLAQGLEFRDERGGLLPLAADLLQFLLTRIGRAPARGLGLVLLRLGHLVLDPGHLIRVGLRTGLRPGRAHHLDPGVDLPLPGLAAQEVAQNRHGFALRGAVGTLGEHVGRRLLLLKVVLDLFVEARDRALELPLHLAPVLDPEAIDLLVGQDASVRLCEVRPVLCLPRLDRGFLFRIVLALRDDPAVVAVDRKELLLRVVGAPGDVKLGLERPQLAEDPLGDVPIVVRVGRRVAVDRLPPVFAEQPDQIIDLLLVHPYPARRGIVAQPVTAVKGRGNTAATKKPRAVGVTSS